MENRGFSIRFVSPQQPVLGDVFCLNFLLQNEKCILAQKWPIQIISNDKYLRFFTKVNLEYSYNMAIVIFWLFLYNLNSTYGKQKILRNGV